MTSSAFTPDSHARLADDRNLLAASGLLDEASYRLRAGLDDDADAVSHYLTRGWLQGIEPRDGFDGEFLREYYEAAGQSGPPALIWLELSVMPGRRAPMNHAEALGVANRIRGTAFFDADAYSRRIGSTLDPALHYAVVGELLGWRPSTQFDPTYYLERYPDIARAAVSPLEHYTYSGHQEGRCGLPAADRLSFPLLTENRRPTVLLVVHEASRTGAPLLGWNVARRLAASYSVVSVLMRGGVLEQDFAAISSAAIGPMTWEDWCEADMKRIAQRLVDVYKPRYAITSSVETHMLVPALAKLGVPSVALVHEFAAYTRPLEKMRNVLDWATHVVFPARIVLQSSVDAFPSLARRRGVHVLAQGQVDLPPRRDSRRETRENAASEDDVARRVRPESAASAFVVLGVGSVHVRKGVDLFLAAAAAAKRLAPDRLFRFVWIGDGYDPAVDSAYSTYLAEQIVRSDLADTVCMLDAIEDLDAAFANADMFFMSSRLDPQPNVGIDALTRGLPTVCFDGACGTAEALAADSETRPLVVPYVDAHAAAVVICRLAGDRAALDAMALAVARVARATYDIDAYVRQIDEWGQDAASALRSEDLQTLVETNVIDADLALPGDTIPPGLYGLERHVLQQWAVVGISPEQVANPQFRRPCAGFHPQIYAASHQDACVDGNANPLAHWVRAGKPLGRWSRHTFSPLSPRSPAPASTRVALHVHCYFVLHAQSLAARLARNETPCDLFVSTDAEAKAALLRSAFATHKGRVDIRLLPNRGRDIGPFLTGFRNEIAGGGYDVVGHLHEKRSHDAGMGNRWREFLWENLVGGAYPMLDVVAAAFASQPGVGVIIAEDPHLVAWNENRAIAETLAARMGIRLPLDDFFDFPLGNMFWATPAALQPLLGLELAWSDYPDEPLPHDGTILHALERMVPYAAQCAGLTVAGVRVPGTTW